MRARVRVAGGRDGDRGARRLGVGRGSGRGRRPVRVGIVLREQDLSEWSGRLHELAEHAVAAGVDHLTVGDHVSFADGHGADGLIQAAALLSAHPAVSVQTGVYLLALRHPAIVARQLATIALLAPGRFTFGVGVGGDDPRELELCGIDPRERGARTTEALRCVRLFMQGEDVDFRGRFFDLRGAIRPAPAIRRSRSSSEAGPTRRSLRTGQLGDGWLALWVSPRRFAEAVDRIEAPPRRCRARRRPLAPRSSAVGGVRRLARARRGGGSQATMEGAYALPFERFERYAPCGPPEAIAEALAPYLARGLPTLQLRPRRDEPAGRDGSRS